MGQKTHPKGFRLSTRKNWQSNWFASKKDFGGLLLEDVSIRNFLRKKPCCQGASKITIQRIGEKIEIIIHTTKPGLVIGKKGAEIDLLKSGVKKFTGRKDVSIEAAEIKRPDLDAQLLAHNIAVQLGRKGGSFRKVLKKAIQSAVDSGAKGIKVQCSGRLGGAEIARTEWYKEGCVSLQNLRQDVDYSKARAETTYGSIGVKVWVALGEYQERLKPVVSSIE